MSSEFIKEYFLFQKEIIQKNFPLVSKEVDVEGVHDLRVGVKRIRAVLNLIGWIIPEFKPKKVLKKLNRFFKAAGKIRDIHVQQEIVEKWMAEKKLELSEYYNYLKERELDERKRFSKYCREFSPKILMNIWAQVEKFIQYLPYDYLQPKAADRFAEMVSQLIEFKNKQNLIEDDYHKIRILSKETRYTLEILEQSGQTNQNIAQLNQSIRELHRALGKWHDDDVGICMLEEYLKQNSGLDFFHGDSYTLFWQHLNNEKIDLIKEFERNWAAFLKLQEKPAVMGSS